jgi:hypothetical protein
MKHLATVALMLNLGVAGIYAQQRPVNLTFSGNGAASPINLGYSGTNTIEENVAGNGTLGLFTFRNVTATETSPSSPPPSISCSGSTKLYFPRMPGAGIFRFQDGSLLNVQLTKGGDCIDFSALEAHCTLMLQITGGTGRFKNASGALTFAETALPVLANASGVPVYFDESGEITGTILGVAF